MPSEREKMLAGALYDSRDAELQAELAATAGWLARYNASLPADRPKLLRERLGSVGEGAQVRAPFFCDYGFNIHLGPGVFSTSTVRSWMSPKFISAKAHRS